MECPEALEKRERKESRDQLVPQEQPESTESVVSTVFSEKLVCQEREDNLDQSELPALPVKTVVSDQLDHPELSDPVEVKENEE